MKRTRMSVLGDLIEGHGWGRGVELGVWQGATFGYLLERFPRLDLTGVDRWAPIGPYAGKDMADAESRARRHTYGRERARLVKSETVDAAALFADKSLDFVFIDASHDTESVAADIRAWRSKVRPAGMLVGHDADWPSVVAALARELQTWDVLEGNLWTFRCV